MARQQALTDGDILGSVDLLEIWLAGEMGRKVVCELLEDEGKCGL